MRFKFWTTKHIDEHEMPQLDKSDVNVSVDCRCIMGNDIVFIHEKRTDDSLKGQMGKKIGKSPKNSA